jgi:hypothetical protein
MFDTVGDPADAMLLLALLLLWWFCVILAVAFCWYHCCCLRTAVVVPAVARIRTVAGVLAVAGILAVAAVLDVAVFTYVLYNETCLICDILDSGTTAVGLLFFLPLNYRNSEFSTGELENYRISNNVLSP